MEEPIWDREAFIRERDEWVRDQQARRDRGEIAARPICDRDLGDECDYHPMRELAYVTRDTGRMLDALKRQAAIEGSVPMRSQ